MSWVVRPWGDGAGMLTTARLANPQRRRAAAGSSAYNTCNVPRCEEPFQ